MQLSVSILSSGNKIKAIQNLNNTDVDYIHFDVMDNKFVPNEAFKIEEIEKYASICNKKIDAHFMVDDPLYYVEKLKNIHFEYFTFHIEVSDVDAIIKRLKDTNYKIGISIKPNTDLNLLEKYLDDIDLILVMSVEPGVGGQKFIENTYDRINKIKDMIKDRNILIEVDGGINDINIKELDINIAVVGSFITNNENYQKQINLLRGIN